MLIQVISIQPIIFRVKNKEFQFVKPYYLMPIDEFNLIKPIAKGSTLVWNVCGVQISYYQLKYKLINI